MTVAASFQVGPGGGRSPAGCAATSAELRYEGSGGWADEGELAPTSHEVGAHGDLYVCRRCGTVQPGELPSPELLASRYAETDDEHYLDEEAGRRADRPVGCSICSSAGCRRDACSTSVPATVC